MTTYFMSDYEKEQASALRETLNLNDFGAIGDGVTDNSIAFSKLISYIKSNVHTIVYQGMTFYDCEKYKVVFNGLYLITTPIIISDCMNLQFDNLHLIIGSKFTGTSAIILNGKIKFLTFNNLKIDSNFLAECFYINAVWHMGINLIYPIFKHYKNYGLYIGSTNGYEVNVMGAKIFQIEAGESYPNGITIGYDLYIPNNGTGLLNSDNNFTNCIFDYAYTKCLNIEYASNTFTNCHIYNGAQTDSTHRNVAHSQNNYFISCYFDGQSLELEASKNQIQGCSFTTSNENPSLVILDTVTKNVNVLGNTFSYSGAQANVNLITIPATCQLSKNITIDKNVFDNCNSQDNSLTSPKKPDINKILCLSESIFEVGSPNIMTALSTLTGATVIDATQGGSLIANQLAEMADEIWNNQNGENAITFSNDFTNAGWSKIGVSASLTVLDDGQVWNLITKTDNTTFKGIQRGMIIPSNFTGILIECEVRVPATGTPATQFHITLNNTTHSDFKSTYLYNLVAGKTYRLQAYYTVADLTGWIAGDSFFLTQYINGGTWLASTIYARNMQVSFFAPECFTNYIPTVSASITAGSTTLTKCNLDPYFYRDVDVICQSVGRNDCSTVNRYSHYRAFDKLISQCLKRGTIIVIGNCPPLNTANSWDATDSYITKDYTTMYKRLQAKWNTGVDIRQFMLNLTNGINGNYTVSAVMTDSYHPNGTSASLIAQQYVNELNAHRPLSNATPELQGTIRLYKSGTNTGTWSYVNVTTGIEIRKLGLSRNYAWQSSTQNDTIVFSAITGEQLHLLYRADSTYGQFTVIIDEGTPQAINISLDASTVGITAGFHGHFVTDYLPPGNHTVKIQITSTGKIVQIHGLLAI